MTEFIPPISNRETEELIEIAHSSTEHWEQEAIDQAKEELVNRNVSQTEQEKIIDQWNKDYDDLIKEETLRLETNKTESYRLWQMIGIFIFGPLRFFHIYDDIFSLRKENYYLKFKQRLVILSLGFITWFLLIWYGYQLSEKNRLEEIQKTDISDWKEKHGY